MEYLEWLELSSPPAPAVKKPFAGEATPCPSCGWPVAPDAGVCVHCGHELTEQVATTLLSDLKIELPEPVIEVTSAPSHWFDGSTLDSSPVMYNLRLQAEQLRVTTGFDRLICLDDISVEHYPHQLEAAQHALRDMRGRALLADEVGLGKTIEAGIIMKELIERGLVQNVLIVVPAPLTWQWHEEMQTKFHEEFIVLEDLDQLPPPQSPIPTGHYVSNPKSQIVRWLISLDRAKSDRWAERLLAREYDLLVVDEAHKLKNHQTDAYRFINGIRKRYVLMLTATPVHNDLIELYNLVTILRPGHLGTRRAFRQNFVTTVTIQSHSEPKLEPTPSPLQSRPGHRTIYSSDSPPSYLRRSKEARQKYQQRTANTRWLLNRTENFTDLDTLTYLDRQGQKAVAEVRQLIAQGYEVVDFEAIEWKYGYDQRKLRHDFVCRLKLKPQPRHPRPRQPRVERRTTPRNPAALRGLLQEIMIRHRRSSVGLRFPPRRAAVYYLNLTPPERELYDGVSAYIREQLQRQTEAKAEAEGRKATGPMRMTLMTLQKELCSSPQAVAQTLDKLAARQADPRLAEYLALARSIEHGRKVDATQIILSQYPDKFLIFTDYLPTLHALRAALDQAGHETILFHGGMSTYERVEAIRTFRKSPSARVMISTQSGGEGHNLQFCYQLINYDLPWNPMRIEQRIGRLQRLGQKQEVAIFNLSATETIEAYVLELLAKKIRMFELVIGELDLILGELGDERGFEDYIEEAWAGSKSEAELLQMIAELEAVLGQAQTTYEQIRAVSDELSDVIDTRV
jgi:SNF2 family DNA or RNA helicase